MKAFRYRYAKVLEWRNSQLQLAKNALRAIYGEKAAIEGSIENLTRSGEQASKDFTSRKSVSGSELAVLSAYRDYIRREVEQARLRLADCGRRIEEQRGHVIQAERAWRLLDRLRERHLEAWTYETNREQESLAGDLYLAGWNRGR
jgi:flagellar export protein FliJ